MSWALPFLFMQLFLKIQSATEFAYLVQENLLTLNAVGIAFFCLFAGVAISRFILAPHEEPGRQAIKEHSLQDLRNVSE